MFLYLIIVLAVYGAICIFKGREKLAGSFFWVSLFCGIWCKKQINRMINNCQMLKFS